MISTLVDTKDEFIYEVRLPMSRFISVATGRFYNPESISDIHAWVIETFGLPGHKYQYHPSPGYDLVYRFRDESDAAWFKLRWS